MGRKVKCFYCKKDGNTDTFHKEIIKDKNRYFCNQMEYEIYELNEEKKREITNQRNELITWIVEEFYAYEAGMVFPTTLSKRLSPLLNFYPIHIIKETFINNHEVLSWAIKNKNFTSEFNMTCYVMTIIESSINDIYLKYKSEQKHLERIKSEVVEVDMTFVEYESSNQIKPKSSNENEGISRFLSLDDM